MALSAPVREAVHRLGIDLVIQFTPARDEINRAIGQDRILASVSGFLALLALLMTLLGVYGIVSSSVGNRTNEFGVRLALGAESRDIVPLMIREVTGPFAVAVGLGIGLSLLAGRLLEGVLFGLTAQDPVSLLTAAALTLAVATLAVLIPSLRASRLDPVTALRA